MIINNKRIYNNGWSISNCIACSPHDQGKQKQYNADHAFKQDNQNKQVRLYVMPKMKISFSEETMVLLTRDRTATSHCVHKSRLVMLHFAYTKY